MRIMQPLIARSQLWIGCDAIASLESEATRRTPAETGGILLGYWAEDGRDCVVTHVIGPGPNAIHCETRFAPDHAYQVGEIGRLYEQSGRLLHYLGDWHSHPGGTGELSEQDRRTLRTIARARAARVRRPIMLILAGGPVWKPHCWRYRRLRYWPLISTIIDSAAINICGPISLRVPV